ncbi:PREDICTED: uncharacterized protein LOC108529631 [Rhinopithecus bieti]|uniref:uncharacterized protein LOC108529631 n=1 Tax=Rhinopithecus bieti TaxID=61621 RepID=UPI00083C11DF|nr:PREDICTED: uncharacterized protein LOC108529631 [Rhinopithecus bieti]
MLRFTRAPAAAREVAAAPTRPLPKAAPGPLGPKRSGSASLRRRDPRCPRAACRRPPELARLPAREETHSSDHQEQTWRPQPWAWESLFGVLQQCLRTRVSPSLPPRKPRPFSGSLGLQHRCLLQPPKSGKPQTLRVLVTASLVVPGLLLHLFHCPAIALVQPRTIGRKRWRAAGDDCWVFPLVLSGFCEEYVAVSGVRVVSPSLPFGPHK